jgi:dTDP-4-amino-4,6-dideoxygalactose transaminase
MAVPFFTPNPQNREIEADLKETFERLVRGGQFILGPEMTAFEEEIARYLGAKHALAISSGTDALLLALMSLGIGPGDEVLCPSFTFFATAGCVSRVGATPVFVDSCPVCFNMLASDAEAKVSPRTKAIIPVHLYGQSADMAGLAEIARRHSLKVIEDAAQSIGADFDGKKSGTLGDFGAYSFYPTKNLGALGDAGMLTTQDGELADRARVLRNHGMDPKYHYRLIGGNFRLDSLQAAFLRIKLRRLEGYNRQRAENAAFYQRRLAEVPGAIVADAAECPVHRDVADPGAILVIPSESRGNRHIWNQFTLRVPGAGRRDALREFLRSRGVGSDIYYPLPLHLQECFLPLSRRGESLPVAERLSREVLSIPIFPELAESALEETVSAIRDFFSRGGATGASQSPSPATRN